LTINDNVVFVNILPADRPGEKAFVSVTPFAEYYRLDNRIITTPRARDASFSSTASRDRQFSRSGQHAAR